MDLFLFLVMIISFFSAIILAWNVESPMPMFIFLLMFMSMSTCTHFERKAVQRCQSKLEKYATEERN